MTLLITAQLIANTLRLRGAPPRLEGEIDWEQLLHHADTHSLTPLLYATWRDARRLDVLPLAARQRMDRAYVDNARRNIHIRQELLDLHQILAEADVPHLLLKGWSLVESLYPDPATRVLYDHDFLVPTDCAERGHQALRLTGFQPLPAKDQWIEKHLPALWRNDSYQWDGYLFDPYYPRPVELHLRLWEQGWRGLNVGQLPDLWVNAVTQTIAGVPMLRLSNENTLIHLAMHFAVHLVEREARLNQLLDLALFSHKMTVMLDWDRVLRSAAQARVSRFVYASLFLAHQVFGSPLPPRDVWQRLTIATPAPLRVWLAEHGSGDVLTSDFRRRDKGKDYQLTFLAATSILERWSIIRFAALPPLDQLVAKYRLRHRWLGLLLYPWYVAERIGNYSRGRID